MSNSILTGTKVGDGAVGNDDNGAMEQDRSELNNHSSVLGAQLTDAVDNNEEKVLNYSHSSEIENCGDALHTTAEDAQKRIFFKNSMDNDYKQESRENVQDQTIKKNMSHDILNIGAEGKFGRVDGKCSFTENPTEHLVHGGFSNGNVSRLIFPSDPQLEAQLTTDFRREMEKYQSRNEKKPTKYRWSYAEAAQSLQDFLRDCDNDCVTETKDKAKEDLGNIADDDKELEREEVEMKEDYDALVESVGKLLEHVYTKYSPVMLNTKLCGGLSQERSSSNVPDVKKNSNIENGTFSESRYSNSESIGVQETKAEGGQKSTNENLVNKTVVTDSVECELGEKKQEAPSSHTEVNGHLSTEYRHGGSHVGFTKVAKKGLKPKHVKPFQIGHMFASSDSEERGQDGGKNSEMTKNFAKVGATKIFSVTKTGEVSPHKRSKGNQNGYPYNQWEPVSMNSYRADEVQEHCMEELEAELLREIRDCDEKLNKLDLTECFSSENSVCKSNVKESAEEIKSNTSENNGSWEDSEEEDSEEDNEVQYSVDHENSDAVYDGSPNHYNSYYGNGFVASGMQGDNIQVYDYHDDHSQQCGASGYFGKTDRQNSYHDNEKYALYSGYVSGDDYAEQAKLQEQGNPYANEQNYDRFTLWQPWFYWPNPYPHWSFGVQSYAAYLKQCRDIYMQTAKYYSEMANCYQQCEKLQQSYYVQKDYIEKMLKKS